MKNNPTNKLLAIGVSAGLVIYIVVLFLSPKQLDWSLSYSKNDQIPFGNSILFEELKTMFPADEIQTCHSPLYNYLQDFSVENTSFLYISQSFTPGLVDIDKMMELVSDGNHIFIAAAHLSKELQDTLGVKIKEDLSLNIVQQDSIVLNLVNPKLKSAWGYKFKKAFTKIYFEEYDTLKTTVLGINTNAKTDFVKIKIGEGNFFINCNPMAFTNYNLLMEENYEYVFKSLSYLPSGAIIWDEFYKDKDKRSSSALRYILSERALKYAWYLLLFGIVTYLIFGAKRRQRAIPVYNAPENTTLTFIQTIGRLYFKKRNHLDIAQKKYQYFLAFLREHYFINTSVINSELFEEIAEKCYVSQRTVKQLFDMATNLNNATSISEEDLEQFNKKIEFIYQKCKEKSNP